MSARPSSALWALALVLGAADLGLAQAPPPPVFGTAVEAVYVDVFVTRNDRPVPGLKATDFELRDNGVRQGLELLSAESRPILAVMVFDTSSSMLGQRLEALRAAGEAFLAGLRPADQAALVGFSEEIAWLAQPTADKAVVRKALGDLRASGKTAVFDALYAGITMSDVELRPLVVLFTDGEDNVSWLGGAQLRTVAERSNALVHVVGWKPWLGDADAREPEAEPVLREIAELTGGRFWKADSPARLKEAFGAIADAMGHRYVLRYQFTGGKREGWHRIEVKLKGRSGDVHVRRGYYVGR